MEIELSFDDLSVTCLPEPKDASSIYTTWKDVDGKNGEIGYALERLFPQLTYKNKESILKIFNAIAPSDLENIAQSSVASALNPFLKAEIEKLYVEETDITLLTNFSIYTPTTSALRSLSNESKKEPIGINGENLDVLVANLGKEELEELQNHLSLFIDWFDSLLIDDDDQLKRKGHKLGRSQSQLYFKISI